MQNAQKPEQLICDLEKLSRSEQMEEFMFLGLRKMKGIETDLFQKTFDCEIESVYGNILQELLSEQLISREDNRIYLTDRGIDISNYVLSRFLLDD